MLIKVTVCDDVIKKQVTIILLKLATKKLKIEKKVDNTFKTHR